MPERFWALLERDVVVATGPEAGEFLQGQLSQDVLALADGGHSWSWLLDPSGKVVALLRVWRRPGGDWVLETDAGWGDAVLARLQRFKLRTKVDLSVAASPVVAVRGAVWDVDGSLLASPPWPGVEGTDALFVGIPATTPEDLTPRLSAEEYEPYRIAAVIPKMGAELSERSIPAETGLVPVTVSFTKGCYTGQELVARIDSRGSHVPRHLRLLRFSGPVRPGQELTVDGVSLGSVTSVASHPELGWIGLGYVKRAVVPPAEADAGGVLARI